VQVNDPTIFFCFIGSLCAADRGPYTRTGQSLTDAFVKSAWFDFAQTRPFNGFQEDGRNEGRRRLGGEIEKLRGKP
jgi:hypothetical protein